MALGNSIREKLSFEVIKTLVTRFDSFPDDTVLNRNAPFHEAFLTAFNDKLNGKVSDLPFFISLSSWLQGLSTTLGQTFFEKSAHHLCNGEKREYTSKKLGNLHITQSQRDRIAKIIANLSNSESEPNLENENNMILLDEGTPNIKALDFSADVFFENDNVITAIELKSVKPNSGEMRGEKQKILEGKAALYRKFNGRDIKFFIGFPFDPTVDPRHESKTSHNKLRFLDSIINMNKYFDENETLVANELWNLLSGQENTMEQILEIINKIATTEFLEKFQFINDTDNREDPKYLSILTEWSLFSEIKLLEVESAIKGKNVNNKKLLILLLKTPFDSNGKYNFDRYNGIMEFAD